MKTTTLLTLAMLSIVSLASSEGIGDYKKNHIKSCIESRNKTLKVYSIKNMISKSTSYCNCAYEELNKKFNFTTEDKKEKEQQLFLNSEDGAIMMNRCHSNSYTYFDTYKINFTNSCTQNHFNKMQTDGSISTNKFNEYKESIKDYSFSYCYCLLKDSLKTLKIIPDTVNESDNLDSKIISFLRDKKSTNIILGCEKKASIISVIKSDIKK